MIKNACKELSEWKAQGKPASRKENAIEKITFVIVLTKACENSGIKVTENDIEEGDGRKIFKKLMADYKKTLQL